jgi:hypothetical protein
MANTGNLPPKTNINSTTEFFNNYFNDRFTTSPNINDAVVGYFQSVTGNKASGITLASTVIYTALSQGLDPMSLIDEFKKLPAGRRTTVNTPIDASTVNTLYTTYDDIVANIQLYSSGQLFYILSLNIFYQAYRDLDQELAVRTASGYSVERVALGQGQYAYNYFYVSYTEESDELTPYLTMLLNQNRVNTSLLGISNTPPVDKYVQRSILA